MRRPNLDGIIQKLKTGQSFGLERAQYIQMTGVDIPQDKYYTEHKSAVSKRAKEYGYRVKVIPEVLQFEKIKK